MAETIQDIKIILLGETGVGKTNLINAICDLEFQTNPGSTSGSYCMENEYKYKNNSYIYSIWDTAGQERYRSVNKFIIRGSKIILIVYSIDNKKSFNEVNFWINYVKENVGDDKYIMALVANKSDLDEYEKVKYEEGLEVAKKYDIEFLTTSALSQRKIFKEFVNKLIEIYIEKYIGKENIGNGNVNKNIIINSKEKNDNNRKKCC